MTRGLESCLRLTLVRHGHVHESMRGRYCGALDPALADEGVRQMEKIGQRLQNTSVAAVYASPQRRAFDSARALGLSVPLIDARLREIDFGVLEGLTFDEARRDHPATWTQWMQAPLGTTFPRGEPFAVFAARVDAAMDDLFNRHRSEAIVIVAHGGVNRVVLARALGLDLRHMFRIQQPCGAVNVIDLYEDGAIVQTMNADWVAEPVC